MKVKDATVCLIILARSALRVTDDRKKYVWDNLLQMHQTMLNIWLFWPCKARRIPCYLVKDGSVWTEEVVLEQLIVGTTCTDVEHLIAT